MVFDKKAYERTPDRLEEHRRRANEYYARKREIALAAARARYWNNKDNPEFMKKRRAISLQSKWRLIYTETAKRNRQRQIQKYQQKRERLRHILGQYWCQRCGEHDKRCLHIDHINGGGTKERRIMWPDAMLDYYINNPEEARQALQLLCANCNWKKRYQEVS